MAKKRGDTNTSLRAPSQKGVVPVVQPAVVATRAATWLLQLVQLESLKDPTSGNGDSYLAARPAETIVLL